MNIEKNIEITKTRIDFYQYVADQTDWDHDAILKNVSHRVFHSKKRKVLITLLRKFVTEPYAVMKQETGVRIVLCDEEYESIFPPSAGVRPFKIKFVFDSNEDMNRLKLKHPRLMSNIMSSAL